jgi:hypothetical protein
MDRFPQRSRRCDVERVGIDVHLAAIYGTAILQAEHYVTDRLGFAGIPTGTDQSVIFVERPFRREAVLGKKGPSLGVERIGRHVIAGRRVAGSLV